MNPHADGPAGQEERTGKSAAQLDQSEILLGSEEFQTEMISTVMAFQVVCYGHAWKGVAPQTLRHNLLWLIRPSL